MDGTTNMEEMAQSVEDELFQIDSFNNALRQEIGNLNTDIATVLKIIRQKMAITSQ